MYSVSWPFWNYIYVSCIWNHLIFHHILSGYVQTSTCALYLYSCQHWPLPSHSSLRSGYNPWCPESADPAGMPFWPSLSHPADRRNPVNASLIAVKQIDTGRKPCPSMNPLILFRGQVRWGPTHSLPRATCLEGLVMWHPPSPTPLAVVT